MCRMAKNTKKPKAPSKKKKSAPVDPRTVLYLGSPPIFMWDRCALIVWARQPFVDWLNGLPDNEPGHVYTLSSVNDEPSLYLLPPYDYDEQVEELLKMVAPTVFVKQLEDWCTEPAWWPKDLKETKFNAWFRYEVTSVVQDLVDNEPIREEF